MEFGKTFERVAPILVHDFIKEFDLKPFQACGFVGNFGAESSLVSGQQEGWPIGGTAPIRGRKGGIDWPQWTGQDPGERRRAFGDFVEERGLPYPSYKASWEFVKHELKTTHKRALAQVRKTTTLEAAVETAEKYYEGAGVKRMEARYDYARRALELYNLYKPPPPPTEEVTIATLQRDLAALARRVTDLAIEVAKLSKVPA